MNRESLAQVVRTLSARSDRILFEDGLSDAEIEDIQKRWTLLFPPDLRQFLQFALPVSSEFVDWRGGDAGKIRQALDWPTESICFDVEHNDFWAREWGPRPSKPDKAISVARKHLSRAPRLIPVYSHRYLPAEPSEEGNPVFSVYQTDVIYYGENLADYIENEFWTSFKRRGWRSPNNVRRIRFWSDLAESVA